MCRYPADFRELILAWPTVTVFAAEVGVPFERAKAWKARNSIPAYEWPGVMKAAARRGIKISTTTLVELAQRTPSGHRAGEKRAAE